MSNQSSKQEELISKLNQLNLKEVMVTLKQFEAFETTYDNQVKFFEERAKNAITNKAEITEMKVQWMESEITFHAKKDADLTDWNKKEKTTQD